MSIGPWTLIGVLILALAGYLIYVWRDNGGISFRELPGELWRSHREGVRWILGRVAGYLTRGR